MKGKLLAMATSQKHF